jgi:hypothetical protein
VHEALQRLERELSIAQREAIRLLKVVHGYGSSGVGGDIRIAVQKRLCEMAENGQIGGCIFGENWTKSDAMSWKLVCENRGLKKDSDLERRNQGITIVVL